MRYKAEAEEVERELEEVGREDPDLGKFALDLFDLSANLGEIWRGSNSATKKELLACVSLNRMLSDVSLVTTKRKPFDEIAKRPVFEPSRDDKTRLELFCRGLVELQTSQPLVCSHVATVIT